MLHQARASPSNAATPVATHNMHKGEEMKDVKVDVRVNVDVDAASIVVLVASAAVALFLYKQHKQEKSGSVTSARDQEKIPA